MDAYLDLLRLVLDDGKAREDRTGVGTIGVFGATTLFSLVTLPVEFDASNRALAWLESSQVATGDRLAGAKDALWWAAMTYVVAALSSLTILLYLILRFMGSRN